MYETSPYFYGTGRRKKSVARVRVYAGTGKITIVAINDTSKTKHITYSLQGFDKIGKTAEIIRTSGSLENGEKWANVGTVDVTDNKIDINLKSNSITTIIIE